MFNKVSSGPPSQPPLYARIRNNSILVYANNAGLPGALPVDQMASALGLGRDHHAPLARAGVQRGDGRGLAGRPQLARGESDGGGTPSIRRKSTSGFSLRSQANSEESDFGSGDFGDLVADGSPGAAGGGGGGLMPAFKEEEDEYDQGGPGTGRRPSKKSSSETAAAAAAATCPGDRWGAAPPRRSLPRRCHRPPPLRSTLPRARPRPRHSPSPPPQCPPRRAPPPTRPL